VLLLQREIPNYFFSRGDLSVLRRLLILRRLLVLKLDPELADSSSSTAPPRLEQAARRSLLLASTRRASNAGSTHRWSPHLLLRGWRWCPAPSPSPAGIVVVAAAAIWVLRGRPCYYVPTGLLQLAGGLATIGGQPCYDGRKLGAARGSLATMGGRVATMASQPSYKGKPTLLQGAATLLHGAGSDCRRCYRHTSTLLQRYIGAATMCDGHCCKQQYRRHRVGFPGVGRGRWWSDGSPAMSPTTFSSMSPTISVFATIA
jgi:hypothetical protein